MNEDLLREKIDHHLKLIKYDRKSVTDAPERATAFLIMSAILADEKRLTEQEEAKLNTLSTASYSQAYARHKSTQVTDKKTAAENDGNYTAMRESLEECKAKISWLKAYMEIFNNAHILYRNFSKE